MIAAVLQARMSSTRLPGKVLRPILGRPMLWHQLERIRQARRLDEVVLATSTDPSDDPLAALAQQLGVRCFRGALADVLDRFYCAAASVDAEHVVRLTADCPLTDPVLLDQVVAAHCAAGSDYCSNVHPRTYPDGLDVEVMRTSALRQAWQEAQLPSEREHVTPFLYHHPERFCLHSVRQERDLSRLRWVVDHAVDLEVVTEVYRRLWRESQPAFGMAEVLALVASEPDLFLRNADHDPDEGWRKSLAADAEFLRTKEPHVPPLP